VTSWNIGAERIHGWPEAEILGEHISVFYPEADRKAGLPFRVLDTARREGRFESEGWRVRKDGSRFAADVVLYAATDAKGEITGFTKITRDVTDRKQRELAEAASAAKSRFLAQMSHEFRTPLNAIIGFSEIIKTELLGDIGNRKYVTYGSDIHYSGLHLLSLVNDLLDLTRIEVGKLEPMRCSFDIKPVAERAIRLFDGVTSAKRIKIDLSVAGDLSAFVADERMVRQCIVNLVDNAIKYSGSGGTVRVAIGRLDDRLTIRVIDQGRGMAQAEIPRALEPFGRVGDVMTTPIEGIGLGLPLVKSYCELHGGQLAIKSAPGAGTEIVLSFPYSGGSGGKRSAA
jgi:PAS domain S-box-containing protein